MTIQQAIDLGVQHHNAGELKEAERIYKQILQSEPNQPVALHLLGLIAHQVGKSDIAADLIGKALAIKSNYAEAHNNLGVIFGEQGLNDEAAACYQRAITIKPDYAEAHNNLGQVLKKLGKLDDAVSSYRKTIIIKPDLADVHYNLGNVIMEQGKMDDAVACYRKALAIKPEYAEVHNNLGVIFSKQGMLNDAVDSYQRAIANKPDYAEAHNNLGNVMKEEGKLDDAVTCYHKAIANKPDYDMAHINLGHTLYEQGKLDDAIASYYKALAIKPDYAEAHNNLGNAIKDTGKLDEAVVSYYEALAIKPDFAEAHFNLGLTFEELGKAHDAFKHHRRAIALDPENNTFWAGLSQSIRPLSFTSVDEGLLQDLLSLVDRPTVRPSDIVRPVISVFDHHPEFSQILKLTETLEPGNCIPFHGTAARLSAIPLFLRLIELVPIANLKIERMLTSLRRSMLQEIMTGNIDVGSLPFAAALSLQCFTNEYVYFETDEETLSVERLQQQLSELIEQKLDIPSSLIATLGAYRPLHKYPWAQELANRKWCSHISEVVKRQILEPFTELSLRSQFLCLTPIQDTVSQFVREQYEENPYPRWVKTDLTDKEKTIEKVLRDLRFDINDYKSPESPDILIAGCGTGQHALGTASRYKNAHVLAVDLSLSSLSYAKRKTNELNISNIEYAQADIMELGSLDRKFDLIESAGVLHHLGDPLAGWRILINLLRSGGVIKVGLYSETARKHIVEGRSMIAKKGYSTSPEDIRLCRQDIINKSVYNTGATDILLFSDFFSLSECRDLLFHVQEHRFTLLQIKAAMKSMKLEFIGFEVTDKRIIKKFKEIFPNKTALASLSHWHEFELKNPDTFRSMYHFWCRKK